MNDYLEKIDNNEIAQNSFDYALVVVSNLIARATTKWSLQESKMFLCAVSKIKTRDEENWVRLNKNDLLEKLDMDPTNKSKLRERFKNLVTKSYVQFNGNSEDEWEDGVLLTRVKSTKEDIFIKFETLYLPLLDHLSVHFTQFLLDDILNFSHKSSYNLYVYLTSWCDRNYMYQNKKLSKKDIPAVFNLKEGEYWRNYKKDNAKFDWADFERRVLKPAIEDINNCAKSNKTDMMIVSYEKIKKGRAVLGYDFKYVYVDENCSPIVKNQDGWEEQIADNGEHIEQSHLLF